MKFFMAHDGDFITEDGLCMGSYVELIWNDFTVTPKGVLFDVVVLHSLMHDEAESMSLHVSSKCLITFMFDNLQRDVLNKISTRPKTLFGWTFVRPRINHEQLPFSFR